MLRSQEISTGISQSPECTSRSDPTETQDVVRTTVTKAEGERLGYQVETYVQIWELKEHDNEHEFKLSLRALRRLTMAPDATRRAMMDARSP
jgi:hypothetical protein